MSVGEQNHILGNILTRTPCCMPSDSKHHLIRVFDGFVERDFSRDPRKPWWRQQADWVEQIGTASEGRWTHLGSSKGRLAGGDVGRQLFGWLHWVAFWYGLWPKQPVFLRTSLGHPPTKGSVNLSLAVLRVCHYSLVAVDYIRMGKSDMVEMILTVEKSVLAKRCQITSSRSYLYVTP